MTTRSKTFKKVFDIGRHRLVVRTAGFHPAKMGSTPVGAACEIT